MEQTKHKKIGKFYLDVILLFLIPIFLIIVVVAVKVIPSWLANPTYDFVFQSCGSSYCSNYYSDQYYVDFNGKVQVREATRTLENTSDYSYSSSRYYDDGYKLYYADVKDNSWRELSIEEAQSYTLDKNSRSPEGYSLEYSNEYYGGFFPFSGGSSDRGHYLVNGSKRKEVSMPGNYYSEVDFLGWVRK